MAVEKYFIVPRSPAWFALRAPLLTASDVPAAAGKDPFKTPFELYAEKTGEKPPQGDNAAMKRGRRLEGVALEYFLDEHPGWRIKRPNVLLRDWDNRLGATPDALTEDPERPDELINIQVKTSNLRSFASWDGQAPIGYQLQVATENMLLGAKRGILAVLVLGFEFELHLFDIERNAAAEQAICDLARTFWYNIEHGIRPPPDYERDAETIAAMFPRQEAGKVIDLSGDNRLAEILPRRMFLTDQMAADKKERDALDAEIKLKLGDAEIAEIDGWRLTWKAQDRKGYTVAPTTTRPLHVKQIEQQEQAA